MRISSSEMYSRITGRFLQQEAAFGRVVEQLASDRRMLSPADDPLAAARAIAVAQNDVLNTSYAQNRATAGQNLSLQESALNSVVTNVQGVLSRLVQVGNATLSDLDRKTLATDLTGIRNALVGLANTGDGHGGYIFSGYESSSAPYSEDGAWRITRANNAGAEVQVSQGRVLTVGNLGSDIFSRANPGSTGLIVSTDQAAGSTAIAGKLTGEGASKQAVSRSVEFFDADGVLSYSVTVDGKTSAPKPYQAGTALDLGDGLTLPVAGQPAPGDEIAVRRESEEGVVDIFGALNHLINNLNAASSADPESMSKLANALSTTTNTIQNGYNNVLTVRASIGTRLQEIESLDALGATRSLSNAKQLSELEGIDFVKTISEVTQRQTALTAAGMAFKALQGLNLFTQN